MRLRFTFAGVGLMALGLTGSALAGVLDSKHNLSDPAVPASNNEVCVYCHTPHGAAIGAAVPLWNKALSTATYQRYSDLNTSTLDGEEVAVGSVSLACLSCHDGTQAVDVVINAPGSGGHNPTGAQLDPVLQGTMAGTPVPQLGTDLRDDHPISIDYAGGACQNVLADCDPAAQAAGDPDFVAAQYASINGQDQWWVDVANFNDGTAPQTGTANTREKTDMILYTRAFTGGNGPSVECASCHDPHEDTARPVEFMRISNQDSGVCLACHIK